MDMLVDVTYRKLSLEEKVKKQTSLKYWKTLLQSLVLTGEVNISELSGRNYSIILKILISRVCLGQFLAAAIRGDALQDLLFTNNEVVNSQWQACLL